MAKPASKPFNGKQLWDVECSYRFGGDNSMSNLESVIVTQIRRDTPQESYFHALGMGLDEFRKRTDTMDNIEALACWRMAIVSSRAEFLDEIERQVKTPDEADELVRRPYTDPIRCLKHFGKVELLLIAKDDAKLIVGDTSDFKIEWN